MESRIRSIFLVALAVLGAVIGAPVLAQDQVQVIEPQVERRDLDVAAIDTEDFEVTAFLGPMSVEDFETNLVYGARLAYHVTPALFLEGTIGQTDVGESSAERVVGSPFFTDRTLTYYDASLGWNILPGESFFGRNRAFNSVFYLIGGVGSIDFADDSNFAINFGFGFKIFPVDFIAIRLDARNYLFDASVNGSDKTLDNMQGTLNVSWFFRISPLSA